MKHFRRPWFRVVTTIFQNPLALVAGFLLCLSPIAARGQSVIFVGAQHVLPTNGLNIALGVAVDRAGDVFIASSGNGLLLELRKTSAS